MSTPKPMHHLTGVEEGVAVVLNKWLEYHMSLDRIDRKNHAIICAKKSLRPLETVIARLNTDRVKRTM